MNENWPYIKENIERFPEYKSSIFEQGFLITNQDIAIGGAFPILSKSPQNVMRSPAIIPRTNSPVKSLMV